MNKYKIDTIMFSIFGVIMSVLHLIRCNFEIKEYEILANLSSSSKLSAIDQQRYMQFVDFSKYTEIAYYLLGIAFFSFVGYKLIYKKIKFLYVIMCTIVIYLLNLVLITPLLMNQKDVINLLLPIFVSLFFSLLIIAHAALKRHLYEKSQDKL